MKKETYRIKLEDNIVPFILGFILSIVINISFIIFCLFGIKIVKETEK